MNKTVIDPRKVYTKMAYSKAFNVARATIDRWIRTGKLDVLKVNGTVLIIAE